MGQPLWPWAGWLEAGPKALGDPAWNPRLGSHRGKPRHCLEARGKAWEPAWPNPPTSSLNRADESLWGRAWGRVSPQEIGDSQLLLSSLSSFSSPPCLSFLGLLLPDEGWSPVEIKPRLGVSAVPANNI